MKTSQQGDISYFCGQACKTTFEEKAEQYASQRASTTWHAEKEVAMKVKAIMTTKRKQRVKRLPVVNRAGELQGILSIGDILFHTRKLERKSQARRYKDVARTLQTIDQPSASWRLPYAQSRPQAGESTAN